MTERAATLVLGINTLLAPVGRGLAAVWAFERGVSERAERWADEEIRRIEDESGGRAPGINGRVAIVWGSYIREHWQSFMALFPEPERGRIGPHGKLSREDHLKEAWRNLALTLDNLEEAQAYFGEYYGPGENPAACFIRPPSLMLQCGPGLILTQDGTGRRSVSCASGWAMTASASGAMTCSIVSLTYDGDGYYSRYDEDPQAPAR